MTVNVLKHNYSLRRLARIKTGGKARYYAPVSRLSELQDIIALSKTRRLPLFVLGSGSNVLISDGFFDGIVVRLTGDMSSITFGDTDTTVTAGGGASLMQLGQILAERGYSGCAYMTVIPGTVGGAVRINAGHTPHEEIATVFQSALLLDPATGALQEYTKDQMEFGYRTSTLAGSKKILVKATFDLSLQKKTGAPLGNAVADTKLRELNRSRHLQNGRTFGSVFRNAGHDGHSAAWYLDRAGLKGLCVGGARVSEEHANWIINNGSACTGDIKKLMDICRRRVFEKFSVRLEREVVFLPEDMEEWS